MRTRTQAAGRRARSFCFCIHRDAATLIAVAVLASVSIALGQAPQAGSGGRAGGRGRVEIPPGAPHDPKDLTGIWLARGTGIVMNNVPAMTAEGQAKFNANKPSYGPRAIPPALGNDAMGNCDPLGIPRLLFFEGNPWDFEIIQLPDRLIEFFDRFYVYRQIWIDRRALPKDP